MDIRKFFAKKPRIDAGADSKDNDSGGSSSNTETGTSKNDFKNKTTVITKNIPGTSQRPDDLPLIGEPIQQVVLKNFPKQNNNRSFHAEWYRKFKWMKYFTKLDGAFCYTCRQF